MTFGEFGIELGCGRGVSLPPASSQPNPHSSAASSRCATDEGQIAEVLWWRRQWHAMGCGSVPS